MIYFEGSVLHLGKHRGTGHKHPLSHLFNVVSRLQCNSIATDKDTSRKQIEVAVLWRISGTLEHVQHLLCYKETTWERDKEH